MQTGDQDRQKRLEELRRQRAELDKLITELSEPQSSETNIPYSPEFLTRLPAEEALDLRTADARELLNVRLLVNKKCNQISTDYQHTAALVEELLPYRNNVLFTEIFARKLVDQGRIQVSAHPASYRPLSYVLHRLGSRPLAFRFVRLAITKQSAPSELCGIYAIYFGYLNLSEDVGGCWTWTASVLNTRPNQATGYVLETFLTICGDLLFERVGYRFMKILRYIKKYFLKEIRNAPVESRISTIIEGYERKQGN